MSEDLARIRRNIGWLLLRHVTNKGIGFVTTAYLARQLGAVGFGQLAAVLSFSQTFAIFSHLGLIGYTVKEVAASPERAPRWFGQGMVLIGALSALTFATMMGVAWALGVRLTLPLLSLVGWGLLMAQLGNYAGAYAQGLERMGALAAGEVILRSTLLAGCWLALSSGAGLMGVGMSYLLAYALFAASMTLMIVPRLFRPTWEVSRQLWREKLAGSWPYFLSGVLTVVYMNSGTLLSAHFAGAAAAAYFSAAFGMMMAVRLIPNMAMNAVFPTLVRRVSKGPEGALPLYAQARRLMLSLMLPISVGGALLARNFVALVFGEGYAPAALPTAVMFGALWLMTLNATVGYLMVAANRIPVAVKISFFGVVIQGSLALAWIPGHGALGATWAFAGAEIVTFLVYVLYLARSFGDRFPAGHLARTAAAALAMGWIVGELRLLLHLPVLILVGAAVYTGLLALFGGIDEQDRRLIASTLRGRQ